MTMDALFACTKCHSRHPFEELSDGKQLCKNCRNNYPTVKCTYCRAEFQQEDKTDTSSICKKCAHNVKHYGKPKACEFCSIIAAFIGNKCQRCANCEKKYGLPQTCEQCKQQCAFDRQDDSRKKQVDGKLLCWLCTMAYKRVLAKTKHKGVLGGATVGQVSKENHDLKSADNSPANVRLKTSASTRSASSKLTKSSSSSKLVGANNGASSRKSLDLNEKKEFSKSSRDSEKEKKDDKSSSSSSSSSGSKKHKADSNDSKSKDGSESGLPAAKKQKTEKSANGLTQLKSSDSMSDFSSTDHLVAITSLREEVESLKKQLSAKDQQILEREKKLTELKAQNYESEKEMRNKIAEIQKKHTNTLDIFQDKVRDLQRQLAKNSKS